MGANLITYCLFPAPFSGKLLSDRLHSQLCEYAHLWDSKNVFHVLGQTSWDKIFLTSQLCSKQTVQDVWSTAHFMELGLIKNSGWFKMHYQLGLFINIMPSLSRIMLYGFDRLKGDPSQLA